MDSVSDWLGDEEHLNSGCRLHKRSYKELDLEDPLIIQLMSGQAFDAVESDAKLAMDKLPTKYQILIATSDGSLTLHPSDVGMGISQVVPVIVTALDGFGRLLAIEQPELHIHPRLQAELGDLFIEATKKNEHVFLIETHSEHLILRLLRRIRETSEDDLPPDGFRLQPDQISVLYIESTEAGVKCTSLEIDETGEFLDDWPHGFFDERAKELF